MPERHQDRPSVHEKVFATQNYKNTRDFRFAQRLKPVLNVVLGYARAPRML